MDQLIFTIFTDSDFCFDHEFRRLVFLGIGFVIPTKSFVKIGLTKIFCYNNKMFSSINKTFGCCSKIFGCSNKKLCVVSDFVAVTKPFFPVCKGWRTAF